MALPPVNMSVMRVVSAVNIETFVKNVSNVSSGSWVESHSLVVVSCFVVRNNSNVTIFVERVDSSSDTNSKVSVGKRSNSSCSPVEDPPLLVEAWVVVHDSQSVLMSSNVFMPEESSVSSHSRFDLEFDSISQWISSVVKWFSVKVPSLISSIVANVVDDLFVISVSSMENIKAVSSWVSEILSATSEV